MFPDGTLRAHIGHTCRTARPQIEAKARELTQHVMRDTGIDLADVSPATMERIIQAVATDLQEDADRPVR